DPVEALEVLLHEYKATQANLEKGHKERLAQSLAKASSIPYGKVLSQEEMRDLVDRLFACNSPNYSPGGKPVISIISMEEFEEKFN
ncbi:MAG: DNA mismatch repair protein MutL, partial [Bacteroidota bacterium]|nr:DNA mismatch repair protein MutL [Bacteroidota bacterium]